MPFHMNGIIFLVILGVSVHTAHAHVAAWHQGMYCLDGTSGTVNYNSNEIVNPLYQLPFHQWWFHHVDRCDEFPPASGTFLDLPAGGSFMVEVASNRAKTSLSYGARDASDWPDGGHYPENYNVPNCITNPNLHAQNQSRAAGTAFAISYESDIKKVTPENLVVFSVRHNTPWKRVVWYDVPAGMPACPTEGCICAWGWVPNGCGQPNIYHQPFRCRVTNAWSITPISTPKPPVWCEGNPNGCVRGAKQMIYWNQLERNNIQVQGFDSRGDHKSPGYNHNCGFADGAQNDIFIGVPATGGNPQAPGASSPGQQSTGSGPQPTNRTPSPPYVSPTAAIPDAVPDAAMTSSLPSSSNPQPSCRRRRRPRVEKRMLNNHHARSRVRRW
ncbi:hypothetical protein FA15DRAFT_619053 [Coprinopsis marcescibilis]|uniref:Uncharacterized protein n=1 Tax=Coprinopsis marcescibilis TaxID=230819 RepID=A0A5C3KW19_COPMA|nr:hypothetical protein FA15DRAFT_619053 [Coprinopsis marcescibilis]